MWLSTGRQDLKAVAGVCVEHLGLRGRSHDICVLQKAFPKARGYNRALAHVCAHAMRVIQPCAFGTVYRRGCNRAPRSMVSCMSTYFMRGYNRALRSMAICRLRRVHDHIFLALQTAFRVQCQRNTWPWLYSAGSTRLPKSTKTGTSPSHRRRGPGTPSRKHVE